VSGGFAVTLVADGPRALALSRTCAFDALIVARELPTLSGLEVTRILRQRGSREKVVRKSGGQQGRRHQSKRNHRR
jgi:CheY-like chemotaxis protein